MSGGHLRGRGKEAGRGGVEWGEGNRTVLIHMNVCANMCRGECS